MQLALFPDNPLPLSKFHNCGSTANLSIVQGEPEAQEKAEQLNQFRTNAQHIMALVKETSVCQEVETLSGEFQKGLARSQELAIASVRHKKFKSNAAKLSHVLLVCYASSVAGLCVRQGTWQYTQKIEFARRIGEIWEKLAQCCFRFPVAKDLEVELPRKFPDIWHHEQVELRQMMLEQLPRADGWQQIWDKLARMNCLRRPENISLKSEILVRKDNTLYNIDAKNSCSSRERGYIERIIDRGQAYMLYVDAGCKNIILVRTQKPSRRTYLDQIERSGYWDVRYGTKTYETIEKLTGFNLKAWEKKYVRWEEDLDSEFAEFLCEREFSKFIDW